MEWFFLYPEAVVNHLIAMGSDHCPLILHTHGRKPPKRKVLRFEEMWMSHMDCKKVIEKAWGKIC